MEGKSNLTSLISLTSSFLYFTTFCLWKTGRPGVNIPPVAPVSKNDALKAVMHERSVEPGAGEVSGIDILHWGKKDICPLLYQTGYLGRLTYSPFRRVKPQQIRK